MRIPSVCVCLLALVSTTSCSHTRAAAPSPPPPPADPCRGDSIRLEALTSVCEAADSDMPAPPAGALETVFEPVSVQVTSGETVTIRAELRNVTGEPLELFVSPLAGYLTSVVDGDERVDERWLEERMGGIVGRVRPWRVVLEPGGVIGSDVAVSARITTLGYEPLDAGGYSLVTGDGGPIPPGDYTLRVYPPLSGEHDISFPGGWGSRPMVELPLRVTPGSADSPPEGDQGEGG